MNEGKSTVDFRIYTFDQVVGNVSTINLIRRGLAMQKLPRALIYSGNIGTGKSTSAEITGLALTCENPSNGNPCLKCQTCLVNLEALKVSGESRTLIKKNVAKMNSRADTLELIKEIFVLESPGGNCVYILEGLDTMAEVNQLAFVEEIDRLPANTTIIICTNSLYKIVEDIRSRCVNFRFSRLQMQEASKLFDDVSYRLGITSVPALTKNTILKFTKGIPREIVKQVNFIKDMKPTEKEFLNHLGVINSETFTNLLASMSRGVSEMGQALELILANHSPQEVAIQFSDYFINVMFFFTNNDKSLLSKKERDLLQRILDKQRMFKICSVLETLDPYHITQSKLNLKLIHVTSLVKNESVSDIISGNTRNASKQYQEARALSTATQTAAQEIQTEKSARLNLAGLNQLTGGAVKSEIPLVKSEDEELTGDFKVLGEADFFEKEE